MQTIFSPKDNSYSVEELLMSARSAKRDQFLDEDQREQDLQLLIRAHERIRQL